MTFYDEYKTRLGQDSDIQGHLTFLYEEARKRAVILELGVRSGNSTTALLAGAQEAYGHLYSIDTEPPQVPDWWCECTFWSNFISNDLAPDMLSCIPKRLDMLFIDTSHTFAQTFCELFFYGSRLSKGGIICCHDTNPVESSEVAQALNAYCEHSGQSWFNHAESNGLGIIKC